MAREEPIKRLVTNWWPSGESPAGPRPAGRQGCDGYAGQVKELADDPLFLEQGVDWRELSPKLVTERRLPVLALFLAAVAVGAFGIVLNATGSASLWWPFALVALVLAAVGALLFFVVVPRAVAAWRFAEREQDLLVRRGRILRRLTVVPYGRMQVIEVSANPVSHRLGIATVTLVTASASTDARIPGLPAQVAQELRDRLAAKGEASTAGL